jgi:(2Fe-2S) ferredoxin
MSRAPKTQPKADRIWVCHGCCCGTMRKHPDVDHRRLRRIIKRRGAEAGCRVTVTDCLGPCGQGNIVVVRRGGEIRWFRKMHSRKRTKRLTRFLLDGGDLTALPPALEALRMRQRDGRRP